MPEFSLSRLRPGMHGIRNAFEEFCCQIFRRAPEAPPKGRFRRIQGAGGDGGIEAMWESPGGKVWGLQAKFFDKLDASQKAQMRKSLDEAVANYPQLDHYTFTLPLTLTGKKGAKAGKGKSGQHELLASWINEWQADISASGRFIEIDFWDESELLSRLAACDCHGGLMRYWFDEAVLSPTWFNHHLEEARLQAGKRYTPSLSVSTPLAEHLAAFGRTETWVQSMKVLGQNLSSKVDWWRGIFKARERDISGSLPEDLVGEGRAVLAAAETVDSQFLAVLDQPSLLVAESFWQAVRAAQSLAMALEPRVKAGLEQLHGDHADTKGFRQFSAEYNVAFPMAPLDHLRDLIEVLGKVDQMVSSVEGHLPSASVMLVHGPAGIGKTHGVLDVAFARKATGLRSVVLFGEDFNDDDPWVRIAAKFGLGATGREELLDVLDAAGEATGHPLVIFIDALNEASDRRCWQRWLPPMSEQIARRRNLKLCFTCRDTYLREVIPDTFDVPRLEHNGFAGRQQEAIFQFFRHYGLGLPVEPLLQEEFSNPLFLHLVCEALKETGASAIPMGRQGIRAVINLLLGAKNEKAAPLCSYDARAENRVHDAIAAIAGAMAAQGVRHIPLGQVRVIVEGVSHGTPGVSLFDILERESLVTVVGQATGQLGMPRTYSVRFTFERMGDYFIAEHLMATLDPAQVAKGFGAGGTLHFLVVDALAVAEYAGLLEAVSVHLAEVHGLELPDVTPVDATITAPSVFAGLQWRNPQAVSSQTVAFVQWALGESGLAAHAWEAVIKLSTRAGHPLNARFLDQLLGRMPLLVRDPTWSYVMNASYTRPQGGGVWQLIDWAHRGHLDGLEEEVATLWAIALSWFCTSPDRRIRDRATKGLVRVFRARPATIRPLLAKFLLAEDEYVAERVLLAAYGALLLARIPDQTRAAASEVYARYFADPAKTPLNASLRDHGRLIIELAIDMRATPKGIVGQQVRPPYASPWPINLPSEADVAEFVADQKRFPRMNLVEEVGVATGSDFARYIVHPRVTSEFDIKNAGLGDELGLFRWFLQQAVEMGYPGPGDRCAAFDRMTIGRHGPGRGKLGWAERLGKKYYWVFLRRLVGQIADHVGRTTWSGPVLPPSTDLQALDLRDIDPTDIRVVEDIPDTDRDVDWMVGSPYVFPATDDPRQDRKWVAADDLPDVGDSLIVHDTGGAAWQVLDLAAEWNGERRGKDDKTYRHVYRGLHTLFCDEKDVAEFEDAFSGSNWSIDLSHLEPHDYRGYLGEYPDVYTYRQRIGTEIDFAREHEGVRFEAAAIRQLKGAEWKYDYSVEEGAPSMLMPAPFLIRAGGLKWDARGGWADPQGIIQISDPYWWKDGSPALIIRLGYLDKLLTDQRKALAVFGFQTKSVLGGFGVESAGLVEEWTAFLRCSGMSELIGKKLERYGEAEV